MLPLLAAAGFADLAPAQKLMSSGHSHTTSGLANLEEAWAAVATPGDGLTYSVANILVTSVEALADRKFDGADVDVPVGLLTGNLYGFNETVFPYLNAVISGRQVVLLQATDNSGAIRFQSYYYGWANGQQGQQASGPALGGPNGLSTNVRSISVWAGATPADTRIAICGETFEHRLPNGQADNPIIGPPGT